MYSPFSSVLNLQPAQQIFIQGRPDGSSKISTTLPWRDCMIFWRNWDGVSCAGQSKQKSNWLLNVKKDGNKSSKQTCISWESAWELWLSDGCSMDAGSWATSNVSLISLTFVSTNGTSPQKNAHWFQVRLNAPCFANIIVYEGFHGLKKIPDTRLGCNPSGPCSVFHRITGLSPSPSSKPAVREDILLQI